MWIKQHWHMPEDLQKLGLTRFEQAMQLQGKIFRDVPGRKTMQIALGSKSYFIKQHWVGARFLKTYSALRCQLLVQ